MYRIEKRPIRYIRYAALPYQIIPFQFKALRLFGTFGTFGTLFGTLIRYAPLYIRARRTESIQIDFTLTIPHSDDKGHTAQTPHRRFDG